VAKLQRTWPSPPVPNAVPGTTATCFFLEEAEREIAAREAGGGDVREDIERAARAAALEAHVAERGDDEVAAAFVFAPHALDAVLPALEGLDGGVLAHDGSTEDRVLVDFHHGLDEVYGAQAKPMRQPVMAKAFDNP
jgi:hypothetical protein